MKKIAIVFLFVISITSLFSKLNISKSKFVVVENIRLKGSPFSRDSLAIPVKLSTKNLDLAFELMNNCVNESNSKAVKNPIAKKNSFLTLSDYKFQIVAAKQQSGDTLVWINAFCNGEDKSAKTLKNYIVDFNDGGKCFFNLYVNLTKRNSFGLSINGKG